MSIRFQWSSLVSTLSVLRWMMIRSPSKFRLHEFVYFSAGIAIAGRWHRWVDEISHRFTNFAKVDDGFVLARIWTTTVWSGLWIIFLEWWLSRIGIGIWQSAIANRGIRISICQLVVDQRSQHFRLDLLIFPRVQMGAIVGTMEHCSNVIKFQFRYKKNPILLTQVELSILCETRKV